MTLFTQHRQRCSAWLALFAIALLFIAPVISQALAPTPAASHHEHTSSSPNDHHSTAHALCDYCLLPSLLPWLAADVITLAVTSVKQPETQVYQLCSPPDSPGYPPQQPRAPPEFSIIV